MKLFRAVYTISFTVIIITSSAVAEIASKSYVDTAIQTQIGSGDLATIIADAVANKADKVTNAVSGNLAALDANGNIVDSGVKPADFATVEQVSTPENVVLTTAGAQSMAGDYTITGSLTVPTLPLP
ncbi:MAG: hypothetical protein JW985_03475 [Alphaproteobacteria bacterium]|nr:hypothetical protein [Alphaproteobacteria bacterium]